MKHVKMIGTIGLVLFATTLVAGQQAGQPADSAQVSSYQTYVFMQASPAPADRKGSEVFRKVVDDLQRFLRENRVNMAVDPSGMNSQSESDVPLATVLANGKKSGAASVLYSRIEVPGKAIRIKTTAYALDGNTFWEANAGCELADKVPLDVCMKVTFETLHEVLKFRIRESDIPVLAAEKK